MSTCALCDDPITAQNDSKEHIIPNALGGRKKVIGFICNACNNNSGDEWESELAKQLNPLSLFFGISRERKKPPSEVFTTTAGEQYKLNPDGSMELPKPIYKTSPIENGVNVQIQARTMKEAKQLLQRAKKEFPNVDVERVLSQAKSTATYCSDMLEFNLSIGGQDAGRSIVKSALALVVNSGVTHLNCEHAKSYLRKEGGEACFGYFYNKDIMTNRPEGVPLHCVYVAGQPETKQILGYIEFFGIYRMVLCLSSNYDGNGFERSYCLNPITGEQLDVEFDLQLSVDEIREAYSYGAVPNGAVEDAISKVLPPAIELDVKREISRVSERAVKEAFANCGAEEGEYLTDDQKNKVMASLWENIEPFVLHQISSSRNLNKK
jgi:hypothetical protein